MSELSESTDSLILQREEEEDGETERQGTYSNLPSGRGRKPSKDKEKPVQLRVEFEVNVTDAQEVEQEAGHLRRHLESSVHFLNEQIRSLESLPDARWKLSRFEVLQEYD